MINYVGTCVLCGKTRKKVVWISKAYENIICNDCYNRMVEKYKKYHCETPYFLAEIGCETILAIINENKK